MNLVRRVACNTYDAILEIFEMALAAAEVPIFDTLFFMLFILLTTCNVNA